MRFSELMEKYKQGEATPEEIARVEAELERQEAIEAYLAEQLESAFGGKDAPEESGGEEAQTLSKKVNKRLRKVTFKAAAIVLAAAAAVAGIVLGVRFFNDKTHYDPNRGYEKVNNYVHTGQFYLDVRAYTELHCPGYMADFVKSVPQGNGVHRVRVALQDSFGALDSVYDGVIVRGELEDPQYMVWPLPIGNAFGYKEGSVAYSVEGGPARYEQPPYERESHVEDLSRLQEDTGATAFLTFREDLSLLEFAEYVKYWEEDVYVMYAAVRAREGRFGGLTTGFEPTGSGVLIEGTQFGEGEHPGFQLRLPYPATAEEMAACWEQHFRTLLEYMAGRGGFLQALGYVQYPLIYEEMLAYIDENGVQVYGIMVQGEAGRLLQMEREENIFSFYVDNVKFSRLEKRERQYAYELG